MFYKFLFWWACLHIAFQESYKPNPSVDFWVSLRAYLKLYRAGFRITRWTDPDIAPRKYARYRFFWKHDMIKDMADIAEYDGFYNTMLAGHVEELK